MKKSRTLSTVALMSVYIQAMTFTSISSCLSTINEAYPGVSSATMSYLVNGVSLTQMFAALVCGVLVGTKVGYRSLALTAVGITTVAGGLPFFLGHRMSFAALLASRLCLGLGAGIITPLCQTYVTVSCRDEGERTRMLGLGSSMMMLGSLLGTVVASVVVQYDWTFVFVIYLVGAVSFVLVLLFLREPEAGGEAEGRATDSDGTGGRKEHVPGGVWVVLLAYMVAMILNCTYQSNMSYVIDEAGGSTVFSGVAKVVMQAGCIVVALAFSAIFKRARYNVFWMGSASLVLGYILAMLGGLLDSVALVIAAGFFVGVGTNLYGVGIPTFVSDSVPAGAVGMVMSLSVVAQNLGTFINSPFLQLTQTLLGECPSWQLFGPTLAGCVILTIACLFICRRTIPKLTGRAA